jgi:hypothetical protein
MLLADRRSINFNDREVLKTPLLVPSFSSKGFPFPEVKNLIEYTEEFLTDTLLVSAYDVHYKNIPNTINFVPVVFLDSGGYESGKEVEFSDLGVMPHSPADWTPEMHRAVVDNWDTDSQTVLISYDHTSRRYPIEDQIIHASTLFKGRQVIRELLIKPETVDQKYIQIDSVINNIHKLAEFEVIGLTEKELGKTVLDRMKNIAKVRMALQKVHLQIPIHIFGSLDTMTTPLYFLAGADIFDGLTWLRFAYHEGYTMYIHNYAIKELGTKLTEKTLKAHTVTRNIYALQELQLGMSRYLNAREFKEFPHHSDLFERLFQNLIAEIREA